MSPDPLARFVHAQADCHAGALKELAAGAKRGHWMWFVFPQLRGLGRSAAAWRYGIADRAEAQAYLAHSILGPRLEACVAALMGWAGRRSAEAIFGPVDAMKLCSSLTLFEAAGGGARFARALEAFCGARRDPLTLAMLSG